MSRSGTPRRSTRSQSRDPEGSLSDKDVDIGVQSPSTSSFLSFPAEKPQTARRRPRTPKKKSEKIIEESITDDDALLNEESKSVANLTTPSRRGEFNSVPMTLEQVQLSTQPNARRRKALQVVAGVVKRLPFLPPFLLLAALLLLLALPTPEKPFRRNVYVDENALQPGSASVEWNWGEVEFADQLSRRIADVAAQSSAARASFLSHELRTIGLTPFNQTYQFDVPRGRTGSDVVEGINTYARWTSARGDGREAFVISAAWKSAWNGDDDPDRPDNSSASAMVSEGSMSAYERKQVRRTNVRGIASVLTIARHLISYKHWSKDLIFVFGDGELDGMQAWTTTYFGREQRNLRSSDLHGRGSLIWNAVCIDYPSDSFSHIVLKHEGLDGQLPNMDVISTVTHLLHRAGGVPVELPASSERQWPSRPLGEFGDALEQHLFQSGDGVRKYLSGLFNAAYQFGTLSSGRPSGVHGLFHRYHVDAITIFAAPAKGPYGFWHMGRLLESLTRSMSNLLERLHHSHFFYVLTSPDRFIEVAKYLPVSILFSAALLIAGIAIWLDEGNRARRRQDELIFVVNEVVRDENAAVPGEDDALRLNGANSTMNKQPAHAVSDDVSLRHPTVAQRTGELVSLLVQRASRRGDLIGTSKIRFMTALIDVQGRPMDMALMCLFLCHAFGALTLVRLATAPIDCARDGVEQCKPFRLLSVLTLLAVAVITASVARRTSSRYFDRLAAAEAVLPDDVIPTIYRMRTAILPSVARTASALAMMEAGVLTLVLSLVNFSLAASLGAILSFTFVFLTSNVGADAANERQTPQPALLVSRAKRNGTPASDDSDAVEDELIAERRHSGSFSRIRTLLCCILFLSFTPSFALLLLKAAHRIVINRSPTILPLSFLDLSRLDRFVDATLWNYQVLSSSFLPILAIAYVPVLLVGATTSLMIAFR